MTQIAHSANRSHIRMPHPYIWNLSLRHAPLRLRLAKIGALFGSQNAIFVTHKYTWECWLTIFMITVRVRYPILATIQL